jgi:hypothetical protein
MHKMEAHLWPSLPSGCHRRMHPQRCNALSRTSAHAKLSCIAMQRHKRNTTPAAKVGPVHAAVCIAAPAHRGVPDPAIASTRPPDRTITAQLWNPAQHGISCETNSWCDAGASCTHVVGDCWAPGAHKIDAGYAAGGLCSAPQHLLRTAATQCRHMGLPTSSGDL